MEPGKDIRMVLKVLPRSFSCSVGRRAAEAFKGVTIVTGLFDLPALYQRDGKG